MQPGDSLAPDYFMSLLRSNVHAPVPVPVPVPDMSMPGLSPYICVYCKAVVFTACRFMEKAGSSEIACSHLCCMACASARRTKKERTCAAPGCGKQWTKFVADPFFMQYPVGSAFDFLVWHSNMHARRCAFQTIRDNAVPEFANAVHPLFWGNLEREMVEMGVRAHCDRPLCRTCLIPCIDNGVYWTCPLVMNKKASVQQGHEHCTKTTIHGLQ